MSTWDPDNDVELTDSEDEIALKRDFHGREAILFVVDANLEVRPNEIHQIKIYYLQVYYIFVCVCVIARRNV